ncbi:UNVERIFIED_CONTAM: hypothetical protein RMT77_000848 [Armadillidium vulgare]
MISRRLNMAVPKEEDCPSELKVFFRQIDFDANRIISPKGEIQNGHLLAMYFCMGKQKSVVFQKFFDILKKCEFQNFGDLGYYNKVYSKCYAIVNKYNALNKRSKRQPSQASNCTGYVHSLFSIPNKRNESTTGADVPSELGVEHMDTNSPSTSNDFIPKDEMKEEENEGDIYERYFDLINQKLDADTKCEKLAALMEEAMTKLHESEIQTQKLNESISDMQEELKIKSQIIDNLEMKVKAKNSEPFSSQNEDLILSLKSKNKHLKNLLKEKLDLIKTLKLKVRSEPGILDKKSQKPRGRRKKATVENSNSGKEKFRKDLERKINNLISEKNSAKISELLLESFPDISISDFEVILKVLTDSNALVNQRIIHKWNVDGEDVTYYGVIKENLKNQKKFYITYWEDPEHEQQSDDYEIVEYNSLIADIILKDLSFTDPCSLF